MDTTLLQWLFKYALAVARQRDDQQEVLGEIHLLKYAYLADSAHASRRGVTLTGTPWRFHKFGPWSQEARQNIAPALDGRTERRSQPRDPDHPRSGQDAVAGDHRGPGQQPAPPGQRQRRRRPRRDRRIRAVGPGARQCRATPTLWARPRSRWAAAEPSSFPISPRCAIPMPSSARSAKLAGKQVVSFSIERAKGASDVEVYRRDARRCWRSFARRIRR